MVGMRYCIRLLQDICGGFGDDFVSGGVPRFEKFCWRL